MNWWNPLNIAGVEAKEIVHHKGKKTNDLGFHLQEEGVVTDVEMYQTAWKSGLRQGSRLVEVFRKYSLKFLLII